MTTPWTPPVLLTANGGTTAGPNGWGTMGVFASIPAGTPLLLTGGWGTNNVVPEAITDTQGNLWRLYAASTAQRPTFVAYCQRTEFALASSDSITVQPAAGSPATTGGRQHLIQLPQPPEVPATPVYASGNSVAPALAAPDAQPGDLLVAAFIAGGNVALTGPTWDLFGPTSATPVFRTVYRIATGPETFSATLASAQAWTFSGVRLVPAAPRRYPLKAWDGTQWRGMARV